MSLKKFLFFICISFGLLVVLINSLDGQVIKPLRFTLSLGGPAARPNNSDYMLVGTQTIGQTSVIQSFRAGGYQLRQGFIQPFRQNPNTPHAKTALEVAIFPNPFDHIVSIQISDPSDEEGTLQLINLLGEKLLFSKFHTTELLQLNLSHLSPGIYLIQLECGNLNHAETLLKY